MQIANAAPAPKQKKPFYHNLTFQVLTAITIGVLLGHFDPGLVHVFERIFDQLEDIQNSLVDEAPKSLEELARIAGSPISDILNDRSL